MNELFVTSDGSHSLFSEKYGVSYHSKYGAVQETKHVFIESGLRLKAVVQSHVRILDIGFGTGLNALMTLLEAHRRDISIDYTAIEAYPVDPPLVAKLNYIEQLGVPEFADAFQKMHTMPWEEEALVSPDFTFSKYQMQFEEVEFDQKFDLVYYDAFAPNAQPELWEADVLKRMYDALDEGGVLTTYCAKGVVKRNLKGLGFLVESLPGPPGKREMTRAIKE